MICDKYSLLRILLKLKHLAVLTETCRQNALLCRSESNKSRTHEALRSRRSNRLLLLETLQSAIMLLMDLG